MLADSATSSAGSERSSVSRSPRAVSPSSPTGWSRLDTGRAARRISMTSSTGRSTIVGDLLLGRLATELHGELTLDAVDLAMPLADVHGQADRAGRVLEAALDRLTDPEGRVRGELEALPPVELLRSADQAQHALLDEVTQGEALALVLTRHGDHQPQVRVDHPVLGDHVAPLDALGQHDLLGGGQQRVLPRLVEEELEGVGGRIRRLVVRGAAVRRRAVASRVFVLELPRLGVFGFVGVAVVIVRSLSKLYPKWVFLCNPLTGR